MSERHIAVLDEDLFGPGHPTAKEIFMSTESERDYELRIGRERTAADLAIVDRGVMIGLRMRGYDISQHRTTVLLDEMECSQPAHWRMRTLISTLVIFASRVLGPVEELNVSNR